jgi:hypothetical protein
MCFHGIINYKISTNYAGSGFGALCSIAVPGRRKTPSLAHAKRPANAGLFWGEEMKD